MQVISVSQLNNYIKRYIDSNINLSNIYIKGEISNFKFHSSGHIYMTLKDDNATLKCVMFSTYASGLKFTPENGMRVIAFGKVSVYERDGVYQLYVNSLVPDGIGELYAAFEKMKSFLGELGYFDEARKKQLPKYPSSIGVVTSQEGAALRDIISVLKRRYPLAKILLYPALVQGVGAAQSVSDGIYYFNREKNVDVMIIGRGGGSIEDLWAFNERIVADAIFFSEIPVISAVGHETDFTISDFVSDLRAPTPSAAAELAVPDINELIVKIKGYDYDLKQSLMYLLNLKKQKLDNILSKNLKDIYQRKIDDCKISLYNYVETIEKSYKIIFDVKMQQFESICKILDSLSPVKTMMRGYSVAKGDKGVISSINQINNGDRFSLIVKDGYAECVAEKIYKSTEVDYGKES